MQTTLRRLPQQAYRAIKVAPSITTRKMSLFPRSVFTSDFPRFTGGEFTPLFRLLDDYASHQLTRNGEATGLASFQPKFDVKENKDNYELHGELPGVEQKDVQIEFTDPQTLVIKGRTERYTESGTPPAGLLEGGKEQGKIADSSKEGETYHKPTVEEEGEKKAEESTSTTVAKSEGEKKEDKEESHYWVSERSVGEFHRTFTFPNRVDTDNVKASLKNGVLSITVPKSQAPTSRKVNIE